VSWRDWWRDMPKCTGCSYTLCFIDRTMDECPMCGTEIPEEVRVDEIEGTAGDR
jgi:predicted RNA-binding Zn-ribbon protein involved in translation (DUF1610 family)